MRLPVDPALADQLVALCRDLHRELVALNAPTGSVARTSQLLALGRSIDSLERRVRALPEEDVANAPALPWAPETVFYPTAHDGWAVGDVAWIETKNGARPARLVRKHNGGRWTVAWVAGRLRGEIATPHSTAPAFVASCAPPPALAECAEARPHRR